MASVSSGISHEERTAREPRRDTLEPVILSSITPINSTIRLLRLSAADPKHTLKTAPTAKFLPGQWLDVFIPRLPKAGGFTITSTPREGKPTADRAAYYELAIQLSGNPPAKWLWKSGDEILGSKLVVRSGGAFVWPPPGFDVAEIDQVVLVAGGVGINPLISIFSHLMQLPRRPSSIRFVYATKVEEGPIDGDRILFLSRLTELVKAANHPGVRLDLYLTGCSQSDVDKGRNLPAQAHVGRITDADLDAALGDDMAGRTSTVCYVCGPPRMTDTFVETLATRDGMDRDRVLCEKWW